jgi:hypothetical protein
MKLFVVPAHMALKAWSDGAHKLSEATDKAKGEVTTDQLKLLLARGERQLIGIESAGDVVAWFAVVIDQLPNVRVLYIYAAWAPGSVNAEVFAPLAQFARDAGASEIRGASNDAIMRIWRAKLGAEKLYNVFRIGV